MSRPPEPPAAIAARIGPALLRRWQTPGRGCAGDGGPALADIAALGLRLRRRGLSARAVAHIFGGASVVHAPLCARAEPAVTLAPAALLVHLMVAGNAVPEPQARRWLGSDVDPLIELGVIAVSAGVMFATVAIMPVGEALAVSDRADVLGGDCALYADDSAFHTIGVVAERARRPAARWLDVGTGSAVIPLARPAAAAYIRGTDINPRALAMAALGAALSGLGRLELGAADLLQGAGDAPWDLITFNAPLPAGPDGGGHGAAPLYRAGPADLVPRFFAELGERYRAGSLLEPGGEVIVHSWQWGDYPACLQLPGRIIAGRYTPPGVEPAMGVTLWQPDRPAEARMIPVVLTPAAPHVSRDWLDIR